MKIYFIRHTDAEDDQRDSFGGVSDDKLIDKGRDYAKRVAQALSNEGIQAIYTSPYSRAKETADILSQFIKCEVIPLYNFRERNTYGVLSGIEKSKVPNLFPEIYDYVKKIEKRDGKLSKSYETIPGAEIYFDLLMRITDAMSQVIRESKFAKRDKIVIVTHGGVAFALFRDIIEQKSDLEKGEIVILEGDTVGELKINRAGTDALKEKLANGNGK